eukprot:COSAG02_NODE_13073_length_1449_cov_1.525926_1_plen_104_part_10
MFFGSFERLVAVDRSTLVRLRARCGTPRVPCVCVHARGPPPARRARARQLARPRVRYGRHVDQTAQRSAQAELENQELGMELGAGIPSWGTENSCELWDSRLKM